MTTVKFSKHALERMEERGISTSDVYRVLAFGHRVATRGNPVWRVSRRKIERNAALEPLRDIRVVGDPNARRGKDIEIVTTYRKASLQPATCCT